MSFTHGPVRSFLSAFLSACTVEGGVAFTALQTRKRCSLIFDNFPSFAERDGLKSWTVIHVVVSCDRHFVNKIVTLVNFVNFVIIRTVRVHLDLLIDRSLDHNFVNGIVTLVYFDFFFKVETPS